MAGPRSVEAASPVEWSEDIEARLSLFRWTIHPPFVPGQVLLARFYHEAATVTEWLMTLRFEERRVGEWKILAILKLDTWREERKEILAQSVMVWISLEGKSLGMAESKNYAFNAGNRYSYILQTSAQMFALMEEHHHMVVGVEIALYEDAEDWRRQRDLDEGNSLANDLRCLSRDLRHLAIVPDYSNVELHSRDGQMFRAHSFMLMLRWKNFFKRHSFNTEANTVVRTRISGDLLGDLLDYMYSGNLPGNFPDGRRPAYKAELFQVIDWYGIHHLYQLFAGRVNIQKRTSKKPALDQSLDFRLQYFTDAPVLNASIFLNPQHADLKSGVRFHRGEFKFQIQVNNVNGFGAWLSYTIWSRCDSRVHAQVILEVTKMKLADNYQRVFTDSTIAHARNYNIKPHQSVSSGPVLFLGCLETFGDFLSESPSGTIEQWFRLKTCLADGTTLDLLENEFSNNFLERVDLLSYHMSELLRQETHVDMRLYSRSAFDEDIRTVRWVHRAILHARVPQLHALLVTHRTGQMLPYTAAVRLRDEVLSHILTYIYTGKLLNVPQSMLDQISDFAIRSNFYTLASYVKFLREA